MDQFFTMNYPGSTGASFVMKTLPGPGRIILNQLENSYGRKFADRWDFVRYAEENELGLERTSPLRP